MAFGSDGNLYVASSATNNVLHYNGATGALLGVFAAWGGTASDPALVAGRHRLRPRRRPGRQLSRSATAPAVLRFDGTTGQYLGVFLPAPAGTTHMLFSLDGDLYLSDGGTIARYDGTTGDYLGGFISGLGAAGYLLDVSPQDEAITAVTVNNVAPTAVIHADAGTTASMVHLTSSVSDVGTLDTITSYTWGVTKNGVTFIAPTLGGSTFSYTPSGTSTYVVTLTVKDDDTGTGTATAQVIVGSDSADNLVIANPAAGTNRVIVFALAGDDKVNAAVTTAPVELVGGAGNDTLIGGTQSDVLVGNFGGDYVFGADDHAADSLSGGAGNDTLDGGLGDDTMAGGVGNDYYIEVPGSSDLLTESGGGGTDSSRLHPGVPRRQLQPGELHRRVPDRRSQGRPGRPAGAVREPLRQHLRRRAQGQPGQQLAQWRRRRG